MKFEINKDQLMIFLLAALLLLSAIETYIRLSREGREKDKELRKLDIEIDTLLMKNRDQKALSAQIGRLEKVFQDRDDAPDETPSSDPRKRLTFEEWEKELGFGTSLFVMSQRFQEESFDTRKWTRDYFLILYEKYVLDKSEKFRVMMQDEKYRYCGKPDDISCLDSLLHCKSCMYFEGSKSYIDLLDGDMPDNTPDETPDEERLTIEEWQEKLGFQIHDPDGFDRTDTKLYERKFTQAQFMAGAEKSTMLGRDILIYKEICDKNPGINYPIHYDNLWALKDQGKPIDVAPRDDGSQEFVESITQGGNYAPPIPADGIPVAPDDRIPHEEKMIEAMTAPEPVESIEDVQELLSSIIYAPFDGEIVEIREGRFTIKANNKNMKISFDCDIFKVALHDKVVKNQILGQKA